MWITSAVFVVASFALVSAAKLKAGIYGDPLYVTPYLDQGRWIEAREAAQVTSMIEGEDVESYSGFFTVDAKLQSNLFFWFFPAEADRHNAPVVLWLQGGPGSSSLYGVLAENGPFTLTDDLKLERREHYWSQELNVIYIDSPVGTGFSFTKSEDGYARDEGQVGINLYIALQQFFQLFPELQANKFFITGESYAGKYIPELAHIIHEDNPSASTKINLEGIAIGDGWIDPKHMMVYSTYLYELGIIDSNTYTTMQKIEKNVTDLIEYHNYHQAAVENEKILALLQQVAGPVDVYNFEDTTDDDFDVLIDNYFAIAEVHKSLHVGNREYSDGSKVYEMLYDDVTQSKASYLTDLLDQYRVLLYNGQLDIIVAYPLTMNFFKYLKWSGAAEYATASREQWYVDGQLAGFTKTVKGFTEVLVRNAGHMVPKDQPLWALDLITRFTQNIPFNFTYTAFPDIMTP